MLYLQQQSVTASLPLSDALKINVVRQRHRRSTTVMEGGVGWGGTLEIIQCGFPLGDLAENSVLTPNDKKH